MSKLTLAVLVIFAAFTLAVAVHRDRGRDNLDDIANWVLDEIGPGYQLIRVKKIKKERVRGTLYHLKLKVWKVIYGGVSEKQKCEVEVLVFDNHKILKHYTCFKAGRGRSRTGSSGHRH